MITAPLFIGIIVYMSALGIFLSRDGGKPDPVMEEKPSPEDLRKTIKYLHHKHNMCIEVIKYMTKHYIRKFTPKLKWLVDKHNAETYEKYNQS